MLKKLSLLAVLFVSTQAMADQEKTEFKPFINPTIVAVAAASIVASAGSTICAPIAIGGCCLGLGWYLSLLAKKALLSSGAVAVVLAKTAIGVVLPFPTPTY